MVLSGGVAKNRVISAWQALIGGRELAHLIDIQ